MYYDPEVSRFINADAIIDNRKVNSQNTFAYCLNNPVMFIDPTGYCAHGTPFKECQSFCQVASFKPVIKPQTTRPETTKPSQPQTTPQESKQPNIAAVYKKISEDGKTYSKGFYAEGDWNPYANNISDWGLGYFEVGAGSIRQNYEVGGFSIDICRLYGGIQALNDGTGLKFDLFSISGHLNVDDETSIEISLGLGFGVEAGFEKVEAAYGILGGITINRH